MEALNITPFIEKCSCSRCNNKRMYDDTPYHKIKHDYDLMYEVACPICGHRDVFNKNFKKVN